MTVTRYILKRQADYFGDLNLSEITSARLREYIDHRLDQVSVGTVQRDISVLRAILNKAFREELMDKVPPFPRLKTPKARNIWLTEDEVVRLVDAAAKHLKPIILFAVDTGGRLSEILELDWRYVDLANGLVTFAETKNGEDRTIPLSDRALKVLNSIGPKTSGPVFTFRGKGIKTLGTSFPNAREAAGLSHVHFHDLRHTFASRLVQGGVTLYDVMHLMGHKSLRMVQRYAHLAPDYQKGALKVLNRPTKSDWHDLDTMTPHGASKRPCEISAKSLKKNGAGDEIRTHDFNLGKVALYP
jgi:integrase